MEFSLGTLEQVLECLPCAALVWDDQHRVIAHNRLAAEQVAIVLGDTLFPPVPETPPLGSGEHHQCWTARLTSPSGKTIEAELATQPIRIDGRCMLLVIVHELRAATRYEEDLAQSEVRLRQAVHVAQLGIFEHDHVKDTIYFSPEHRAIYGWGSEACSR